MGRYQTCQVQGDAVAVDFCARGPGKISWSAADVKATAVDLKASLPLSVTQVITAKEWRGGPLVQLEDTISRPAASDLIVNYWFIKAFVRKCPDKVPSAFFVADVILYMDRLFCERLLIAQNPGENKKSLAGEEGKKIKALMGYLRYLWRSSTMAR